MSGRSYPVSVAEQQIWAELINKERDARLAFFRANDGEISSESKQFKVFKQKLQTHNINYEENDQVIRKIKQAKEDENKFEKSPEAIQQLAQELATYMNAPSAEEKKLLYLEDNSRQNYLKTRNSKPPEEKYQYPILSSWTYGWKLRENCDESEMKAPEHARGNIVRETFYRRNGITW